MSVLVYHNTITGPRLLITPCGTVPSQPKGRRINWKYQSGLLPKFQRAVAQGARELSCIHVSGPGCSPMADGWHCVIDLQLIFVR